LDEDDLSAFFGGHEQMVKEAQTLDNPDGG